MGQMEDHFDAGRIFQMLWFLTVVCLAFGTEKMSASTGNSIPNLLNSYHPNEDSCMQRGSRYLCLMLSSKGQVKYCSAAASSTALSISLPSRLSFGSLLGLLARSGITGCFCLGANSATAFGKLEENMALLTRL